MEKVTFRTIQSNLWRDPERMHWTAEDLGFWCCINANEATSLCGVYPIHVRELAFLARVSEDAARGLLKRFSDYGEIQYDHETHELAIKGWFKDHVLQNPNMAKSAMSDADAVKNKSLLVFANFQAGVEKWVGTLKKHTTEDGGVTVPEPLPNGSGIERERDLEKELLPQEVVLSEEAYLENKNAREEAPLTGPSPGPVEPDQEGDTKLAELLANIEATGKAKASRFALIPPARDGFIDIAKGYGLRAAATAWSDFLKAKGQKLYLVAVVVEDLPEFLAKRLDLLRKTPRTTFAGSTQIRRAGLREMERQAEVDPVSAHELDELRALALKGKSAAGVS